MHAKTEYVQDILIILHMRNMLICFEKKDYIKLNLKLLFH